MEGATFARTTSGTSKVVTVAVFMARSDLKRCPEHPGIGIIDHIRSGSYPPIAGGPAVGRRCRMAIGSWSPIRSTTPPASRAQDIDLTIAHADGRLDLAVAVQVGQQWRPHRPIERLAPDDLAPLT